MVGIGVLVLGYLGCGGGALTSTIQTQYGAGVNGEGAGLVDTNVGVVVYDYADSCGESNAWGVVGTTNSQGEYTYTPPCDYINTAVVRQVSANCPWTNTSNGDLLNVGNGSSQAWQYSPANLPPGFSGVYPLPCGAASVMAIAAPASQDQSNLTDIQIISVPATFSGSYGSPVVTVYDDQGDNLGSTTATNLSEDGSTITITPDLLGSVSPGTYGLMASNVGSNYGLVPAVSAPVYVWNSSNDGGCGSSPCE
jgi:hypothetical protein